MNFFNPYLTYYFDNPELKEKYPLPFATEVIWIFLKNLNNGLKLEECRINFHFTEKDEHGKTLKLNKVYEYYYQINPGLFIGDELSNRKKFLQIIEDAISALGKVNNWDTSLVNKAIKRSQKEILHFNFISGIRTSPNKLHTGQLRLSVQEEKLQVQALIKSSSSSKEFNLLLTHEKQFSWYRNIKDFGWYDDDHFGLKFMNADLWIVVNIHNGVVNEVMKHRPVKRKKMERLLVELKRV